MKRVTFLKEAGYVYDLFFWFALYFNRELCLTDFINYNKSSDDTLYFDNVLKDIGYISDELLLFFRFSSNKRCFMSQYYYEPYKSKFFDETYNLSVVLENITDYDQVKKNLLKFYFENTAEEKLMESLDSLSAVNTLIKEADLSSDIKSALYSFFIEPSSVIRKLSCELMEKEFILSKKYESNFKNLFDLQYNIDIQYLLTSLYEAKNESIDTESFDEIYISFCLCHKNCIATSLYDKKALLLLGSDYAEYLQYFLSTQNHLPELETFGNAISENNRIGILDLMVQRKEVTIKDLEQEFGLTGTNAYYHLSLMIKAGMVKTRNRGRTILYSINKEYFQVLCDLLGKYFKE